MVSMTPEEAQQAETVKRIGEMLNAPWGHDVGQWVANCEDLREIVDSQIQKIAEQTEKIQSFSDEFIAMLTVERELQGKLADQTQKIEAMQKQLNAYSLATQAAGSLMQKQYTKEELRECWEGQQAGNFNESKWRGFIECARFLGAIKKKEG